MTTAPDTDENTAAAACWCCGNPYPSTALITLDAHPETVVCRQCATYLGRRAKAANDALNPTLPGHLRSVISAGRNQVIRLQLHERPILGKLLRTIDRHLP